MKNQERLRPTEERTEKERTELDELRGTPLSVGTLEEIIDENHAIVSSSVGPEYYVTIMSYVDKDLLEPGCSVLLHNKVFASLVLKHDCSGLPSLCGGFPLRIGLFLKKKIFVNTRKQWSGHGSCGDIE